MEVNVPAVFEVMCMYSICTGLGDVADRFIGPGTILLRLDALEVLHGTEPGVYPSQP